MVPRLQKSQMMRKFKIKRKLLWLLAGFSFLIGFYPYAFTLMCFWLWEKEENFSLSPFPPVLFLQVLLEIMFIRFVTRQKVKTLEHRMQPSLTRGFLIMLRWAENLCATCAWKAQLDVDFTIELESKKFLKDLSLGVVGKNCLNRLSSLVRWKLRGSICQSMLIKKLTLIKVRFKNILGFSLS